MDKEKIGIALSLIGVFASLGGWGATMTGKLNPPRGYALIVFSLSGSVAAIVWAFTSSPYHALWIALVGLLISVAAGFWPRLQRSPRYLLSRPRVQRMIRYLYLHSTNEADRREDKPAAVAPVELLPTVSDPAPVAEIIRAPLDSVQRLRELYPYWRRAAGYAEEFLSSDICMNARNHIVSTLISEYVLPECQDDLQILAARMQALPPDPTLEDFKDLLSFFGHVINDRYSDLLKWIVQGGAYIRGDELLASEGYAQLYTRHSNAVKELERVSGRTDGLQNLASNIRSLIKSLPQPTDLRGQ